MSFLDRLGIGRPIVQAGMGGGIARHELAVAVSEAGGLGTIAVQGAKAIERELTLARERTDRPPPRPRGSAVLHRPSSLAH